MLADTAVAGGNSGLQPSHSGGSGQSNDDDDSDDEKCKKNHPHHQQLRAKFREVNNAIAGEWFIECAPGTSENALILLIEQKFGSRAVVDFKLSEKMPPFIGVKLVSTENNVARKISRLSAVASVQPERLGFLTGTQLPVSNVEGYSGIPAALDRLDSRPTTLNSSRQWSYNGGGVDVYVLDDIIESNHSDFQPRVTIDQRQVQMLNVNGLTNRRTSSHGTAMASIIGGGVAGVSKAANIYGIDVESLVQVSIGNFETGITVQDYVTALNFLLTSRVTLGRPMVINASIEFVGGDAMVDIKTAELLAAPARLTFVAAAGNGIGKPPVASLAANTSPARVPGVLVVAASRPSDDSPLSYSNRGPRVDLFAPGVAVLRHPHNAAKKAQPQSKQWVSMITVI